MNLPFLLPTEGIQSQVNPVRRSQEVLSGPAEIWTLQRETEAELQNSHYSQENTRVSHWTSTPLWRKSERRRNWKPIKLCYMRFYLFMLKSYFLVQEMLPSIILQGMCKWSVVFLLLFDYRNLLINPALISSDKKGKSVFLKTKMSHPP